MKKYTASFVRERLSDALDQAELGEDVFIERRGVTYRLSVEKPRRSRRSAAPRRIEILDKAVEAGEWAWDWQGGELRFRAERR
jgi:hypothetical protein